MAVKKMYIYRLSAGYDKKEPEVVEFFYAPNKKRLIQYAQRFYSPKKYNKFSAVKIGISKDETEIRLISDFESWYLRQYGMGEFYAERDET